MSELELPESATRLRSQLIELRESRRNRQNLQKPTSGHRSKLSAKSRQEILLKSDSRCHICGGELTGEEWQADHVLSHGDGGKDSLENYLPAHRLCNAYRWDYSSKEFQWILKIGIWARNQMESASAPGAEMLKSFYAYEQRRQKRRKPIKGT